MKQFKPLLIAFALAAGSLIGAAGCYGTTEVRAAASAPGPQLAWVGNGIWVLEDWPYSVYYYDGYYWSNYDGYWYRSYWYDGGFVRVASWPRTITRIHRPGRYARYHAPRGVRVRSVRRSRSHVRDRRTHSRDRSFTPRRRSRDRPNVRDRRHRRRR